MSQEGMEAEAAASGRAVSGLGTPAGLGGGSLPLLPVLHPPFTAPHPKAAAASGRPT